MNCLVCTDTILEIKKLENNLVAKECPACRGVWLPSFQYWQWVQANAPAWKNPESFKTELVFTDSDSDNAKICPECSSLLVRKHVGAGISFQIDKCDKCAGIWLDKGEWDILKARDLHKRIYMIFSDTWQHSIAETESLRHTSELLASKLGNEDFRKLEEFRNWLQGHAHKEMIFGYLVKTENNR